jgi:hypothetical protein
MLVDDYGRIHSTPITDDNWIQVNIDSNPESPSIYINHEYHPISCENSSSS